MTNRLDSPEWRRGDTFRSLRDLGRQALAGLLTRVEDALDCYPDDDEQDQAIKSDRWVM